MHFLHAQSGLVQYTEFQHQLAEVTGFIPWSAQMLHLNGKAHQIELVKHWHVADKPL